MSVARKILRENEEHGQIIPYIRESKFVVYTTPSELEKHESDAPIMIADVLEEVASSVPESSIITDEIDAALLAAANTPSAKPSRLARRRREVGERKEQAKDRRPEVVIEPLPEKRPEPDSEKERDLDVKPEPKPKAMKPVKTPKKKDEAAKKGEKKEKPKAGPKKTEKKPPKKEAPKKETKKEESKKPAKTTKIPKPQVSDLPGVGPATMDKLAEAGFKTVLKISKADPEKLSEKVSGISVDGAKDLIKEAKKLLK